MSEVGELVGKTPTRIDGGVGDHEVTIHCSDGSAFQFYFDDEDTGNDVTIRLEDLGGGSLEELIGHKILLAEMASRKGARDKESGRDSTTWTFVKLRSHGGNVTMRWYGASNGYYAEYPLFRRVSA